MVLPVVLFPETEAERIRAVSEETIGAGIGWYGRYLDSESICLDISRLSAEQQALLSLAEVGRMVEVTVNDDGEIVDFEIERNICKWIQ